MEKALGRTNALVVAISILVIAFRAGPQTSPYMPVVPERGHQERAISAAPNPRGSSPIPERKFRILAVTPAPLTPVTTPPGGKGVKSEGETGPNENRRRIAQEAVPAVHVTQPTRTSIICPNPQPLKVAAGASDRIIPAGTPSTGPTRQDLASAKIVSLRTTPADKPASNMPREPEPVKAGKPRFLYPDAVSPYHPAPVPVSLVNPIPKPLFDEFVRRVIKDPANKRPALTVSRYSQDKPAKREINPKLESHAVKAEGTQPAAETVLRSPKGIFPSLDPAKAERAGPVDRLPDLLPESPSISLVQAKYESQDREDRGSRMEDRRSKRTGTFLDSRSSILDPGALAQAKSRSVTKDLARPLGKEAAVMPEPPNLAPDDLMPPDSGPGVVKVINHRPGREELTPAPGLPVVITQKAQTPQPFDLPSRPLELTAPIKQEQQGRTIILIPSAMPEPAQGSSPPKAVRMTPQSPTAQEGVGAIDSKDPTPEKIEHLRTLPMFSKRIREGEAPAEPIDPTARQEPRPLGTIFHNPSKLPAGIADSALVLGPANELLESKRAAAQMEPSATIEDKVTKGTSAGTCTSEKTLPAKTSPYFEKWLKDYIQTACGEEADGLAVALDSGNRLQIRFRVKNDADGERIGRKIIALPEMARYQVSFDIDVLP